LKFADFSGKVSIHTAAGEVNRQIGMAHLQPPAPAGHGRIDMDNFAKSL
jgi:hypothetical protein